MYIYATLLHTDAATACLSSLELVNVICVPAAKAELQDAQCHSAYQTTAHFKILSKLTTLWATLSFSQRGLEWRIVRPS